MDFGDYEKNCSYDFDCYNHKVKIYPGVFEERSKICNKPIFRPEPRKLTKAELESRARARELNKKNGVENLSKNFEHTRRVQESLEDISMMNDFDWFLSITFDDKKVDARNVKDVMKKLDSWLRNKVQRNGLQYLLVPEYHKNGRIHCHALVNGDLNFVHRGFYTYPGNKKAMKKSTLLRYGVPEEELQPVYNVDDWKYGFSTAVKVYGDKSRATSYIMKYITKGNDKIFGKYFYSSKNIERKPVYEYYNDNYNNAIGFEVQLATTDIFIKYMTSESFAVGTEKRPMYIFDLFADSTPAKPDKPRKLPKPKDPNIQLDIFYKNYESRRLFYYDSKSCPDDDPGCNECLPAGSTIPRELKRDD